MTSDTELFTGPDCQKLMSKGVELLPLFSTSRIHCTSDYRLQVRITVRCRAFSETK